MECLVNGTLLLFRELKQCSKPRNENIDEARIDFTKGKSKRAKKLRKEIGPLVDKVQCGDYQDEEGNPYYFVYGNALKGKAEEIAEELVETFLRSLASQQVPDRIGYIMWLQEKVVYLELNSAIKRTITKNLDLTREDYQRFYKLRLQIGQTISSKELDEWTTRGVPVQVFLSPNLCGQGPKGASGEDPSLDKCAGGHAKGIEAAGTRLKRMKALKEAIDNHSLSLFIHAPYTYNPCWQPPKQKSRLEKLFYGLIRDLQDGVKIGARGVVVHTGRNKEDLPIKVAVGRMRTNIISFLEYASEECPLLLETPAAQGKKKSETEGDTLSTVEEMIEFYLSVPLPLRKRLGICVDTCHVFAAGYNPLKYLRYLDEKLPGVIKFVHFNDSERGRFAKIDLHYHPGGGFKCVQKAAKTGELPEVLPGGLTGGHIGVRCLTKVAEWCLEKGIPMVTE